MGRGSFLGTREDGDTNLRRCNNAFIQACLLLFPQEKKGGWGEGPVLNVSSASQAAPPAHTPPPPPKKKRGRVVS